METKIKQKWSMEKILLLPPTSTVHHGTKTITGKRGKCIYVYLEPTAALSSEIHTLLHMTYCDFRDLLHLRAFLIEKTFDKQSLF